MTRASCDADHRRWCRGEKFPNPRVIMTDVAPILPPAGGWPQVVVTARGCAALGPVARASSTYKGVPMQNRTLLAAIATAAVVAIAVPSTSHAQVPQTSKGEVAKMPSFNSLMLALDSSAAQTQKLKALTTVTPQNVEYVDVSELVTG